MEVITGADFGGKKRWKNLQSVRTSWGRTLLVSDYADGWLLNWRLSNEDGTSLPMFQGKQGVMIMDGSDDDEEDDYADTLAEDGDLVHYENLQFLHKENLEQLRDFGWLK